MRQETLVNEDNRLIHLVCEGLGLIHAILKWYLFTFSGLFRTKVPEPLWH